MKQALLSAIKHKRSFSMNNIRMLWIVAIFTLTALTVFGQSTPLIEMVRVKGGTFQMGEELGTAGSGDITPVHTVTLSDFSIGKYQVTQAQYQAVMGSNPSYFNGTSGRTPDEGETQSRRPVEQVRWFDAIVFCNRLSIMEGLTPAYRIDGQTNPDLWGEIPTGSSHLNYAVWNAVRIVAGSTGYRLPTEAQWEYAAKGGDSGEECTYSGSSITNNVAWFDGNSNIKTHEVGKKSPNGLGLYDMSGNVWEWCWDRYGSYTADAKTDPVGAVSGSPRVRRGGSWYDSAGGVRSVDRFNGVPHGRIDVIGFRLVRP